MSCTCSSSFFHSFSCPLVNKCIHCDTRLDVPIVIHRRCLWYNFACPTVPKCEHCGVRTDIPEHVPHFYNCPSIFTKIEEHTRALQICACGIYRMWFVSDSENNLLNREVPDLSHLLITNSGEEECSICREEGTDMKTTCGHHFDRVV